MKPRPRARILDVTPEQYLADPCKTPSLSASTAHRLVDKSPLNAWAHHPKLGAEQEATTDALLEGSLMHRLILGRGKDIVVIKANDFRTNKAKKERAEATLAGKLPVLERIFAEKGAIAAKLRDKCLAKGFAFDGRSEVAIEYTDETTAGKPVLCRSMLDHMWGERGKAIELKKLRSVRIEDINRHFVEYGYDIQYAAYTTAYARLYPELEGRIEFTFLFVETEPPYDVVPWEPGEAFRDIGFMRWQQALGTWHECMTASVWPGICEGVVTGEPPTYVRLKYLGDDLDMTGIGLETEAA